MTVEEFDRQGAAYTAASLASLRQEMQQLPGGWVDSLLQRLRSQAMFRRFVRTEWMLMGLPVC